MKTKGEASTNGRMVAGSPALVHFRQWERLLKQGQHQGEYHLDAASGFGAFSWPRGLA